MRRAEEYLCVGTNPGHVRQRLRAESLFRRRICGEHGEAAGVGGEALNTLRPLIEGRMAPADGYFGKQ
jgi:hypothetical protein